LRKNREKHLYIHQDGLTFCSATRKILGFPGIEHEKNLPTLSNPS